MSTITTTQARSDLDIQRLVEDELAWTPDVTATSIGVAVTDGVVALSGEVRDISERIAVKHAALRVLGVTAVVDDLTVHSSSPWPVTETDIAKQVDRAIEWATNVPSSVKAVVDGHRVTLSGAVQWDYERRAAKRAVEHLRGVLSIDNQITLIGRPSAANASEHIARALTRNAQIDADNIVVDVVGNQVVLTGHVRSFAEKRQARLAAWASPHVTSVDDRVMVRAY